MAKSKEKDKPGPKTRREPDPAPIAPAPLSTLPAPSVPDPTDDATPGLGGLQIAEAPEFQRRTWWAQRVAWLAMLAIVGLAMLGLFGTGPLDSATSGPIRGPLRIEHPRFGRVGVEETLHLRVSATGRPEARLWIDRATLLALPVERISPEPTRVEAGLEGHAFGFARIDPDRPCAIDLRVRPSRPGGVRVRAGIDGAEAVEFRQFIYP